MIIRPDFGSPRRPQRTTSARDTADTDKPVLAWQICPVTNRPIMVWTVREGEVSMTAAAARA